MNLNKLNIRLIIISVLLCISEISHSQTIDSLTNARASHTLDSLMKQTNGINRYINYYAESNREPKKFDVTFAGAPFYRTETSLGIGGIASGLYKMNWHDTDTKISEISMTAKVTLTGYYSIILQGNHFSSENRFRMFYDLYYNSYPQNYWGTGFQNGDNNETKTKFTRKSVHIAVIPALRVAENVYIGPSISYDWIKGIKFESDSLLLGRYPGSSALNLGAAVSYDSRDVTYNAYKGIFLNLEQRDYIHFGGNKPFFKTIGDFRSYNQLWKGAVLAFRAYAEFSYGTVPWTMKARGNGLTLLRSYYEGRYEDDNLLSASLELRQRIWKRLGAVVWVEAGNLFSEEEPFDWSHTLSDIGIGLRWELKKRINLRIDYGIGRCGQSSFVFAIKEAF